MKTEKPPISVQEAIEQLNVELNPEVGINTERCITHLENGTGNSWACKGSLEGYATIKSILGWFEGRDIFALKNWAFNAAKLRRAMYQERSTGAYYTSTYLMPLLSDDQRLVAWFSSFDLPFSLTKDTAMGGRTTNPNMDDYHHYNTWLALRGEWETLAERCRAFLAAVPAKQTSYQADHRFHLALAEGDVRGMEAALLELVEPTLTRRRQAEERAYTQYFICTCAVVYAKIAWRHGYQVTVDSPWVPKEWLPVAPLPSYEDAFAFMAGLDDTLPVE